MQVFTASEEETFRPDRHVETILGREGGGDYSIACWEPGQVSPYHCHPSATEIYICLSGGGTMRTPDGAAAIVPGSFVVHPAGELHEYENGPARTVLIRLRYGADMHSRTIAFRNDPAWRQAAADAHYFAERAHERRA